MEAKSLATGAFLLFDDVYCIYKEFKIDYNDIGLLKQSIVGKGDEGLPEISRFYGIIIKMIF